jgi:hypothetical protein
MYEKRAPVSAEGEPPAAPGPLEIVSLAAVPPAGSGAHTGGTVDFVMDYRAAEAVEAAWVVTVWTADGWVCVTSAFDERPRQLAAGTGRLRCTIPRLPLIAGRYVLTAALADPATLHPIVRFGHGRDRVVLDVESPPGRVANLHRQRGQLVAMDVVWR